MTAIRSQRSRTVHSVPKWSSGIRKKINECSARVSAPAHLTQAQIAKTGIGVLDESVARQIVAGRGNEQNDGAEC